MPKGNQTKPVVGIPVDKSAEAIRIPAAAPVGRAPDVGELAASICARVDELVDIAQRAEDPSRPVSYLAAARAELDNRRRRDGIFGSRLFAEPSWDILLDLFIADLEGRNVSVSSACIAASAPTTTALRHIAHLEQIGFIVRRPHPTDSRSTYLQITELGAGKLKDMFRA